MNVPPSWSLNDLYKGKDDPELKNDLDKLKNGAEKFQKDYTGKLKGISPEKFALALSEYESISELDGKILSYARLLSCENLSNEENARFAQRIREISAECGTKILFFTLEINGLSEDEINQLLKDKAVEHYRPYIENVRLFKPHDLSNQVEQILMEKDTVSYAAFVRHGRFAYGVAGPESAAADALHDEMRDFFTVGGFIELLHMTSDDSHTGSGARLPPCRDTPGAAPRPAGRRKGAGSILPGQVK